MKKVISMQTVNLIHRVQNIAPYELMLKGFKYHSESGIYQNFIKDGRIVSINKADYWSDELCPYCNSETCTTGLISKCENCGNWIAVCSMCDSHNMNCHDCPLFDELKRRNRKMNDK